MILALAFKQFWKSGSQILLYKIFSSIISSLENLPIRGIIGIDFLFDSMYISSHVHTIDVCK